MKASFFVAHLATWCLDRSILDGGSAFRNQALLFIRLENRPIIVMKPFIGD